MSVYLSCKKKVVDGFIVEPVTVYVNMIKSQFLIDFNFQRSTRDLDCFEQVCCFNRVLCFLANDSL